MIDRLADRQTTIMTEQKKWTTARVKKQKRAFRKELEVVANAIIEKALCTLDSMRTLRFFAFVVNTILVRLYHQGLLIRESEWVEVSLHVRLFSFFSLMIILLVETSSTGGTGKETITHSAALS